MILQVFEAPSLSVGLSAERPDRPHPNPRPCLTINYSPTDAHHLAKEFLIPYAKPEHCYISFEMGDHDCEVGAFLFVPIPSGLVVAGNAANIKLDAIGSFLDAKARYNAFEVCLGYHSRDQRVTRVADLDWTLRVNDILPRSVVDEKMMSALLGT